MRVDVKVFGSLKDTVTSHGWSAELQSGSGLAAVLSDARNRFGDAAYRALSADNVKVAINQTLLSSAGTGALADGDEVAFLPPVTGG